MLDGVRHHLADQQHQQVADVLVEAGGLELGARPPASGRDGGQPRLDPRLVLHGPPSVSPSPVRVHGEPWHRTRQLGRPPGRGGRAGSRVRTRTPTRPRAGVWDDRGHVQHAASPPVSTDPGAQPTDAAAPCAGGASTWPTSAPRRRSTATSQPAGPVRSGPSCSRSPRPRAGTPRTGSSCSDPTSAARCAATGAPARWRSWPGGSDPSSSSPSPSAPRPARRTGRTSTRPPTMAADERIHEEVVRGLATRGRNRMSGHVPGRGVRRQRRPGEQSRARPRASGRAASRTAPCCSPGSPACSPVRSRWGPASSCRCARSVSCCPPRCPTPRAREALPHLDVDANELALVYRARGMSPADADAHAREVLEGLDGAHAHHVPGHLPGRRASPAARPGRPSPTTRPPAPAPAPDDVDEHEAVGLGHGRRRLELLLLRVRRADPRPAVPGRSDRPGGGARRVRPGRPRAARHRCDRRRPVRRSAAAARAAPARDRVRRRRP